MPEYLASAWPRYARVVGIKIASPLGSYFDLRLCLSARRADYVASHEIRHFAIIARQGMPITAPLSAR